MLDYTVYISKIVMAVVASWLVYTSVRDEKTNRFTNGVTLFLFILFLSGAEMSTGAEKPWTYLVLTGTEQEWTNAFFGGVMILILPAILLAVGGKNQAWKLKDKS
jgi:hypothetical protein